MFEWDMRTGKREDRLETTLLQVETKLWICSFIAFQDKMDPFSFWFVLNQKMFGGDPRKYQTGSI